MTTDLYTLTVSNVQARTLQRALETLGRLGMGQFDTALEALPLRPMRDRDGEQWRADMNDMRTRLSGHMLQGVDGWTSFLSIDCPDVSDNARFAFNTALSLRDAQDSARPTILSFTPEQAGIVQDACEILARLGMGQFEDAFEQLPLGPITERNHSQWHDDICVIRSLVARHTHSNVDGWNKQLSIASHDVPETSSIAWDLYQVIRHKLAWDRAISSGIIQAGEPRKWSEMMSVMYDDPYPEGKEALAPLTSEEQTPG